MIKAGSGSSLEPAESSDVGVSSILRHPPLVAYTLRKAMRSPTLNNWRLIGVGQETLGMLVGEVVGHPSLPDGWITTSAVSEIAEDRSWAKTASRQYLLATPMPDNQALPKAARDALLSRLLRNAGQLPDLSVLNRLATFVEKLS